MTHKPPQGIDARAVWEYLWSWKVAKPYFLIAGVGALVEIGIAILGKLGWIK